MISKRGRGLLWLALPLFAYLVVLQRLWFNNPVWDDYDAILGSTLALMDAGTAKAWLAELFKLHNEHRIAFTRLIAWVMAETTGRIDFRALVLFGPALSYAILALAWAEFREEVEAPVFAAAGFLLFQMSYFEGTLMAMAASSNVGVLFFALACLYFAMRDGTGAAVLCALCGVAAACTQANGLFALPLAAAGCALAGRRWRALALAVIAAAVWLLYFNGYSRPAHHPPLMFAWDHPGDTAHLFLIIVGSIVRGHVIPTTIGLAILAGVAGLAYRRFWRTHPTVTLWIAFILASAGAAAVGRIGFGIYHASRYAINSSFLVVFLFLSFWALAQPRGRPVVAGAVVAAALASVAITSLAWEKASDYRLRGRLLAKIAPASTGAALEPYFGVLFPLRERSDAALDGAARRGLFTPRETTLHAYRLHDMPALPAGMRRAGNVEIVQAAGSRVVAVGWTDMVPLEPGRSLAVHANAGAPIAMEVVTMPRNDVAGLMQSAPLVYSGFRLTVEYDSPEEAARAAASMCVVAEAPGYPPTMLDRGNAECAAKR